MHRRGRWLLVALGVWSLTPLAVLVLRSLAPSWRYPDLLPGSTSSTYSLAIAGDRVLSALATSAGLALVTGVAATILGFAAARAVARAGPAYQRLTMAAALLSVVAPPLGIGVGLQVVLLSVGLGGTVTGVFLAHLVPATGYLTLFAFGVFSGLDLSIEDEARTLGASRVQVTSRVLVPILRRPLVEGMVLGGLVSWGQLALTLLVGGGVVRTLPVELLAIVRSGHDQAGALAALLLSAPPMLAIGLLVLGTRRTGAFV